jgi:hypothetical protein
MPDTDVETVHLGDAARRIGGGIDIVDVLVLAKQGRLRLVRVTRDNYRVDVASLDAYLAERGESTPSV